MAKAKYKKGKDGYFQARVWNGNYVNGKKQYVSIRSKISSKDLENKVNEHNQKLKERKYVKLTDITFCEYSDLWLNLYKSGKGKNTQAMYRNTIEKHFSAISNVRLDQISRTHYQILINNAQGHERTQQLIKMTFKQVIRSAISDKYVAPNVLSDIFDNVDPIRYKPQEKRPLAQYEKHAIFKADFSDQDRAFVYILYGCGLRRGEALALTRFNIDLLRRTINVQNAIAYDKNTPYLKGPKTENGFRTVPIPSKIFSVIDDYVKNLHQEKLFPMSDGGWKTKSSYDKMWARILRKIQAQSKEPVVDLTAHVFRHNYCTNLCYQIPTISIKKIAELMGDTEKMVIEVYNHIVLEKENAEKAVNAALNF